MMESPTVPTWDNTSAWPDAAFACLANLVCTHVSQKLKPGAAVGDEANGGKKAAAKAKAGGAKRKSSKKGNEEEAADGNDAAGAAEAAVQAEDAEEGCEQLCMAHSWDDGERAADHSRQRMACMWLHVCCMEYGMWGGQRKVKPVYLQHAAASATQRSCVLAASYLHQ